LVAPSEGGGSLATTGFISTSFVATSFFSTVEVLVEGEAEVDSSSAEVLVSFIGDVIIFFNEK
jgi:hypothetical protein